MNKQPHAASSFVAVRRRLLTLRYTHSEIGRVQPRELFRVAGMGGHATVRPGRDSLPSFASHVFLRALFRVDTSRLYGISLSDGFSLNVYCVYQTDDVCHH